MVANVGSEMMNWTETKENDVHKNVLATCEQTLTYSGKQGSRLKIFYRGESNGYSRPSFTQELTYDIATDSVITFRKTRLWVKEDTNNEIKFVVLECPAFQYPNGGKIK
jgi:hypothetical protein